MTINYKKESKTDNDQQNLFRKKIENTNLGNSQIQDTISVPYGHNFLARLDNILMSKVRINKQYNLLCCIKFPESSYYQEIKIVNPQNFSKDFLITFDRVLNLTEIDPDLDEEEEDEILNPSNYAVSQSVEKLTQLYQKLNQSFPRGFSSLESRGGVNLIWSNQDFDKEVRVKIPFSSELKESVYYRKGDDSNLIKKPSLEKISELLFWLSSQQPII